MTKCEKSSDEDSGYIKKKISSYKTSVVFTFSTWLLEESCENTPKQILGKKIYHTMFKAENNTTTQSSFFKRALNYVATLIGQNKPFRDATLQGPALFKDNDEDIPNKSLIIFKIKPITFNPIM